MVKKLFLFMLLFVLLFFVSCITGKETSYVIPAGDEEEKQCVIIIKDLLDCGEESDELGPYMLEGLFPKSELETLDVKQLMKAKMERMAYEAGIGECQNEFSCSDDKCKPMVERVRGYDLIEQVSELKKSFTQVSFRFFLTCKCGRPEEEIIPEWPVFSELCGNGIIDFNELCERPKTYDYKELLAKKDGVGKKKIIFDICNSKCEHIKASFDEESLQDFIDYYKEEGYEKRRLILK